MKDFLVTFKFLLKQSLSLNYVLYKIKENKKFRNMFLIMLVVILMCLPSYILLLTGLTKLYNVFHALYFQSLFIVMGLFFSVFLIIFFGMFQIISYFYFSKDIKLLTPLPIKPKYYLLSKFFVIYIWELIISLFIIAPIFIIYGIYEHLFLYQWVTMIISLLFIPLIPLVIVGFITIILMNITNASKHKDALRMIGYVVLIGGLLFIQMFMYRNLIPEDPEGQIKLFENLVNNSSYFLERFSRYYPVSKLIELSINGTFFEALLGVIGLIVVSLLLVFLLSLFLEKVFIRSYLNEQNNDTLKKKVKHGKVKSKPVSLAIAKIDFLTLLKEPVFVFNTLAVVVLLPVIIVITSVFTSGNDQMGFFIDTYNEYKTQAWLLVTLFFVVTSSMIPITSTTFSREGKNNWIMRSLPISAKDHILGRAITAFFTQLSFNLIMIVIIIILLMRNDFPINDSIIYGIACFITSIILSVPIFFSSIYIDLKRPMLKWENPQQPVKQNMNVLITLSIGLIYGILLFLSYQFVFSKVLNNIIIFIIYLIVGIILSILTYRFLEKNFDKNLIEME